MLENLHLFPFQFYISVAALLGFSFIAWVYRRDGWGLPMGVVLATTAVWYHGDALYNDYPEYIMKMGEVALGAGWWQVCIFITAFGLMTPAVHFFVNRKFHRRRSYLMLYMETRKLQSPAIQRQIDRLTRSLFAVWLLLMGVALARVELNFIGLFAPYLGEKVNPWGRGRMGGGIDALLSLAGYVQILLVASFGVITAVARNPTTRTIAFIVCLLAFPFYIFDRTRNTMLATMLPGMLAWVLFRVRGGMVMKGIALLACFMVIHFWFSFVIANRSDVSIAGAIGSEVALKKAETARHEGISMFSELGYMNDFFESGTYQPNYGARYFAEVVNPIPRAIWKGKPTVGLDYAIARGFGGNEDSDGGITASIATGMIGQGVVNFGPLFGPIAAAFLMALWVSVLARQDLMGRDPARLLLFSVGMILTFNMGRDITLLVLYPYVFGWILLSIRNYFAPVGGGGAGARAPAVLRPRTPTSRRVNRPTGLGRGSEPPRTI